jgi:molybdenum cofactor biosynthesis protein MoaC
MKDVSLKPETLRTARATASLLAPPHCLELLRKGETEKGDPLKTARVAGILAAKRTDELIPLCHPLPIYRADVSFELLKDRARIITEVETIAPTGVEMEALAAASVAALTLYDMLKPYATADQLAITDCRLEKKRGGKSQFHRKLARSVSAAVIVLSDTVAAGKKPDTAGRAVEEALKGAGFDPVSYEVLPDEPALLGPRVKAHLKKKAGFIATVGGTGLGPRDKTIETVRPLLTTEIPGVMEAARAFGQRRTPYAMLSRGIAGFAGNTLIVTFPGSRRGAEESVAALLPGLIHLLDVFKGARHRGGYK